MYSILYVWPMLLAFYTVSTFAQDGKDDNCERMVCTADYDPVCGRTLTTYNNLCQLNHAKCLSQGSEHIFHHGICLGDSLKFRTPIQLLLTDSMLMAGGLTLTMYNFTSLAINLEYSKIVQLINATSSFHTYLSSTPLQEVMLCYQLGKNESLSILTYKFIFYDGMKQYIRSRLHVDQLFKFNISVPQFEDKNLHEVCPLFQSLFEKIASSNGKLEEAAKSLGLDLGEFKNVLEKLGMTDSNKEKIVGELMWDRDGVERAIHQMRMEGKKFLMMSSMDKLSIPESDILSKSPFEIAAFIHGTTTKSVVALLNKDLLLINSITLDYLNMSMSKIAVDLKLDIAQMKQMNFDHLTEVITLKVKDVRERGGAPLIFSAFDAGINDYSAVLGMTLLSISELVANTTETFLAKVYNISPLTLQAMKVTSVGNVYSKLQLRSDTRKKFLSLEALSANMGASTEVWQRLYFHGLSNARNHSLGYLADVLNNSRDGVLSAPIVQLNKLWFDVTWDELQQIFIGVSQDALNELQNSTYNDAGLSADKTLNTSIFELDMMILRKIEEKYTTHRPSTTRGPGCTPLGVDCVMRPHEPVCGTDLTTYQHPCFMSYVTCLSLGLIKPFHDGVCKGNKENMNTKLPQLLKKLKMTEMDFYNSSFVDFLTTALELNATEIKMLLNVSTSLHTYLASYPMLEIMWCYYMSTYIEQTTVNMLITSFSREDMHDTLINLRVASPYYQSFNLTPPLVENGTRLHDICPKVLTVFRDGFQRPENIAAEASSLQLSSNDFINILNKLNIRQLYVSHKVWEVMASEISIYMTSMQMKQGIDMFLMKITAENLMEKMTMAPADVHAMKLIEIMGKLSDLPEAPLLKFFINAKIIHVDHTTIHYFNSTLKTASDDLMISSHEVNKVSVYQIRHVIKEKVNTTQEQGEQPIVAVAYIANIKGLNNVMNHTILDLALLSNNITENFLSVLYQISSNTLQNMKTDLIGSLSLISGLSEVRLQFLSLEFLSDLRKRSKNETLMNYIHGVQWVRTVYKIEDVMNALNISKDDMEMIPVGEFYKLYFGLKKDELKRSTEFLIDHSLDDEQFGRYIQSKYAGVAKDPSDAKMLSHLDRMVLEHVKQAENCQKQACIKEWQPVCGSDKQTYWNQCYLESHQCNTNKSIMIDNYHICYDNFGAAFFQVLDKALSTEQKLIVDTSTIFEVAGLIGVSVEHITKQYHIEGDLLTYLNSTSFNDVAQCYTLIRSLHPLRVMFDQILKLHLSPSQGVQERIARFHQYGFTTVNNHLPSANDSIYLSMHKFCTILPQLYELAYDPYLLQIVSLSHGETPREQYKEFLKAFNVEQPMKLGILAYFKNDLIDNAKSKHMVGEEIRQLYSNITIPLLATKLNMTEQDVIKYSLTNATAKYKNVTTVFIHYLFLSGGIQQEVSLVSSKMTLEELFIAFGNSSLAQLPLLHTLTQIRKSGLLTTELGTHPLVVSAFRHGLTGVNKIMNHTLMQLSMQLSQLPEKFFIVWYSFDEKTLSRMRNVKLSHLLQSNYTVYSPAMMQHFSISQLSSSEVPDKTTIMQYYHEALHYIYKHIEFQFFTDLYVMSDADVNAMPVIKLIEKYQGLKAVEAKKFFTGSAYEILNTFTPTQLLNTSTISGDWTFSRINETLETTYGALRLKAFFHMQTIAIPYFCAIVSGEVKELSFEELAEKCVGVSLEKDEGIIGVAGKVLSEVRHKSLNDFLKSEDTSKDVPYLNIMQLATLSLLPESKALLKPLKDIISANLNLTTSTLASILQNGIFNSSKDVRGVLNGWLGNEAHVNEVFVMTLSQILLSLKVNITTLSMFSINDIISSVIATQDFDQTVFLQYQPSKILCAKSMMSSTLKEINSCFQSSFLTFVNTDISDKFTLSELVELTKKEHDVLKLDIFSMSIVTVAAVLQMHNMSNTPLVFFARDSMMPFSTLVENSIATTISTVSGASTTTLQKVFSIPESRIVEFASFNLSMLYAETEGIDNVEQLYSLPLKNIIEVLSERVDSNDVETYFQQMLSKAVKMISSLTFKRIAKVYEYPANMSYFEEITLVKLSNELFGITDVFFKSVFELNGEELDVLKKRRIGDVFYFSLQDDPELPESSPTGFATSILNMKPFNLQDMLLSTLQALVTESGSALSTIDNLVKNNKHGVQMDDFKAYYEKVVGKDSTLDAKQFVMKLMSFNLTKLSSQMMSKKLIEVIKHLMSSDNCFSGTCKMIWTPLCGTDKKSYINKCHLQEQNCIHNRTVAMMDGEFCLDAFESQFFTMPLDSVIPTHEMEHIDDKTLFEVANIIGVSVPKIIEYYHIKGDLFDYLNMTSLNEVAQCFTLLRMSHSLKTMFDTVRRLIAAPSDRIYYRIAVLYSYGFVSVAEHLPPANSTSYHSLESFCSLLPGLYEKAYDPYLLHLTAKSHGNTLLDEYREFLKAFNIENSMKGAILAYFKNDAAGRIKYAMMVANDITRFYNSVNISMLGEKLQQTEEMTKGMSLAHLSARYTGVKDVLIQYLYLSGGVSMNVYTVAKQMSLKDLNDVFKKPVYFRMPLSNMYAEIHKVGNKANVVGHSPFLLGFVGIEVMGLENIMKRTLMEASVEMTKTSEKFIASWFMISNDDINRMKSKPMKALFTSESLYKDFGLKMLQHLTPFDVSSHALSSRDDMEKGFIKGLYAVYTYVQFHHMPALYAMLDSDVSSMTVLKLFETYQGVHIGLAREVFSRDTFDLFNTFTAIDLMSHDLINETWTISAINKTVITTPKLEVFINMQQLVMRKYCKIDDPSMNKTFDNIAQHCVGNSLNDVKSKLGLAGSSLSYIGDKSIHDIMKKVTEEDVQKEIDYLNMKQIATLAHIPQSKVFLKPMAHLINDSTAAGDFDNETFVELLKNAKVFETDEEIRDALDSWLGQKEFTDGVYQTSLGNIGKSLAQSSTDLFKMSFNDIAALLIVKGDDRFSLFLQFAPSKILCPLSKISSTLKEINSCFDSIYLKFVNTTMSGRFTPADFLMLTNDTHNVEKLDFFSISFLVADAVDMAIKKAHTSLIFLARHKGISKKNLEENNLIITTTTIFGYHKNLLQKIFEISDYVMGLATTYSLRLLHTIEDGIDNVKQVYTVPLLTLLGVVSGRVQVEYAVNYELPKVMRLISAMNFTTLAYIYEYATDMSHFKGLTLTKLAEELFGVNEGAFKVALGLSDEEMAVLTKRTIENIIVFSSYAKLPIADLPDTSPQVLLQFVSQFESFDFQELLLSTPEKLQEGLGNFTTLQKLLEGNKYNVTLKKFMEFVEERFVKYHYLDSRKFVEKLENYDLQRLPPTFKNAQLITVVEMIGHDLQFDEFVTFKLSDWTDLLSKQCHNLSCTLNVLLQNNSKTLDYANKFKLNSKYVNFIGETTLQQYAGLIGLSQSQLHGETLMNIFTRLSKEYERLEKELRGQNILFSLDEDDVSFDFAKLQSFGYLLGKVADTDLKQLQFHKQYEGLYNESFIEEISPQSLKNLGMTFKYMNNETLDMTPSAIVLLTWDQVIKFFQGGMSLEDVVMEKMGVEQQYRRNSTVDEILKLYKISKDTFQNKSMAYISMDLFGLNNAMLQQHSGLTVAQIDLLKRTTILDFNWIMPSQSYFDMTLENVEATVQDQVFEIFTASMNNLTKRNVSGNFDSNNNSLLAFVSHYGNINKTTLEELILHRMNVSKGDIYPVSYGLFNKYIGTKHYGDYAASFKRSMTILDSMKIKDLLIQTFDDLNNCNKNASFCQQRDALSSCVITSYANECQCMFGYQPEDDMCKDIDECGTNPCPGTAQCINIPGGHTCTCSTGFNESKTEGCIDINECKLSTSPCDARVNCTNTVGSFMCGDCPEGFAGNGTKCEDLCSKATCPTDAYCVNSFFGASCQCREGYVLDLISLTCKLGKTITKVKGIRFTNETYITEYANKKSKAFVDMATKIEKAFLRHFHEAGRTSVVGVQVTSITQGSIIVDMNVIENSTRTTTTSTEIKKEVNAAIKMGSLANLDVDINSSPVVQETDVCKLGTHACGAHATCVTTLTAETYKCQCNEGYEMDNKNVCQEKDDDDDDKLLVAVLVPVLAAIIITMVILIIFCSKRKEKKNYIPGSESAFENKTYQYGD